MMMKMRDHRTISIADQIFEQLEKEILSGKYPRGMVLSEQKLAEQLGVSRTPVREAVRRLEQERILSDTGKGLTVVGISKDEMLDMYEIRIALAHSVGHKAATNITDEEIKDMEDLLDLQRYYIEKGDPKDNADNIKDLDSKFHELLYESCRSQAYADVLLPMHRKMTKFRKASISKKSRAEESIREHYAILDALKARDPELVGETVLKHTIAARDRIMEIPDPDAAHAEALNNII